MRYRGDKIKHVPKGEWTAIDVWIYLGSEDPYCYLEIAYDVWWLESQEMKQHCLQEFAKKECIYLGSRKVDSDVEFLQVKVIEDCLGVRGSRRTITHGIGGWHRLHKFEPDRKAVTIHGPLLAIAKGEQVVQIAGTYVSESLWFDGVKFYNAELTSNSRSWVKPHWVTVQQAQKLDDLPSKVIWLNGDRETTYTVPTADIDSQGVCNTIVGVEEAVNIFGEVYHTTQSGRKGKVTLSCGPRLCNCADMHRAALIDQTPEHTVFVDDEQGVFSKMFDGIRKLLVSIVNGLFSWAFGPNWIGQVMLAAVTYYITSQISGSVGAGVGLAVVVVWKAFVIQD